MASFACTFCGSLRSEQNTGRDEYLSSYELVKSYTKEEITMTLTQMSMIFPQLKAAKDKAQHGIEVYQVAYSTTFQGKKRAASGLVCVPVGDGRFPLFSFQNGTNTLHRGAPSVDPNNRLFVLVEFMASTGFVMVMPDYLGFGKASDMFHPYLHRKSTVRSVVDMNRAARELVTNHLAGKRKIAMSRDIYLNGYSQGAWASLQVQREMEENLAKEFNLKASSCGAGPYDLNYMNEYILNLESYPMPYYLGYIFSGFSKAGELKVVAKDLFKEPFASRVGGLFDGTRTGGQINAQLTTKIKEFVSPDYFANHKTGPKYAALAKLMAANSVTAWKTKTPTKLFHGLDDNFIAKGVSEKMHKDFIKLGVSPDLVQYIPLPGLNHESAILPAQLATFNWFLEIKGE